MSQTTKLRRVACAVALGAAAVAATGCGLEVGAEYPVGYYDYPPDEYIATTEPVYFEGRPAYWYGNRWYYRDGARWAHYDREPTELYQHRIQAEPARRVYEAPPVGRPPMGRPGVGAPAGRPSPRPASQPPVGRPSGGRGGGRR